MRKLKLRKRISNFPKAIQLVSDRFEIVYLTPKLFISFKVNCLKWDRRKVKWVRRSNIW